MKLSRSISVGTQEVTLLAALLRTKVSKVSAVWIGAGMELNEKVPMLGAFNHVITLVDVGGEPVWLDVTAEVAPYRALLKMLRDKQALVVLSTGDPELRRTPAELPFSSVMRYEANSSWIALSSTPSRAGTSGTMLAMPIEWQSNHSVRRLLCSGYLALQCAGYNELLCNPV